MHTILNFATKFFDILTKKQFEHPLRVFQVFQVFQVFRVFQVFHFAFGPQNRPVLVQIRTNPENRYPPTSAIKWVRKTPKKAIHPLVYLHVPVRQAVGVVFFRRSRLFILFHTSKSTLSHHCSDCVRAAITWRRRLYFRCTPKKRAIISVFIWKSCGLGLKRVASSDGYWEKICKFVV